MYKALQKDSEVLLSMEGICLKMFLIILYFSAVKCTNSQAKILPLVSCIKFISALNGPIFQKIDQLLEWYQLLVISPYIRS